MPRALGLGGTGAIGGAVAARLLPVGREVDVTGRAAGVLHAFGGDDPRVTRLRALG